MIPDWAVVIGRAESTRLGCTTNADAAGTLFKHLTTLAALRGLTLEGSNCLTDEGVHNIAALTSLQQLHLVQSFSCPCHVLPAALPAC